MKKLLHIFILLLTLGFAGCSYDDDALWNKVDDLDDRVTAIEDKIKSMDQNISTLQSLIGKKLFITGLDTNSDGSYTLHLINAAGEASTMTIRNGKDGADGKDGLNGKDGQDGKDGADGKDGLNGKDGQDGKDGADGKDGLNGKDGQDGKDGKDGKDGSTPEISVAQGADGIYYWTVNGEFILDKSGNRIPVTGDAGADGKDAVTPTFKIENGLWYVSFDYGLNWTSCGKATGEDGDSFFSDARLSSDGSICYLTLADGTELAFEVYRQFNIAFDLSSRFIAYGRTLSVPFTIIGGNENATVEVLGKNGFEAEVKQQGLSGTIEVTAPETSINGKVIVFVSDGADKVIMRTLTFVTGQLSVSTSSIEVAKAGETVDVEVTTDLEFTASFPDDCSWARVAIGSRAELRTEKVRITADPNDSAEPRQTYLTLYSDGTPIETILVTQKGAEYAPDRLVFIVQPEQELADMIGMAQVPIYNSTGNINIDWGDGTQETVASSLTNITNRRKAFAHTYTDPSKEYEVQVWCGSGAKITYLNRNMGQATNAANKNISGVCDSTLVEVVQWGNAGTITNIELGTPNLRKVNVPHPDAFKALTAINFKWSYLNQTTKLTSIPSGFLDGAVKLTSASSMFYNNKLLRSVPEDLFAKCAALYNAEQVFYNCISLERGIKLSYVEKQLRNIRQLYYDCKNLRSIPANAFPAQLSSGPNFNGIFYGCESLEEIPADALLWIDNDKDPKITALSGLFTNCKNLRKLDVSFINRTPKVFNFSSLFKGCENLEIEVPTYPLTLDDGTQVQVKLWERANDEYKKYFANRSYSTSECFEGAVKVKGYRNEIPTSWGGLWDGTGGDPVIKVTAQPREGHGYYTIDFTVKSKDIVKMKYFLAEKPDMERALKYYNYNYLDMLNIEGDSIDSKWYDEKKYIDMMNSDEGYLMRFNGGEPNHEYVLAVAGYNYLGSAVDAATIATLPLPKGSDAYESYVGRWRVTSASSISDYIEYEPHPISFEVTIEPYRVDSMYAVSGWGVTPLNDTDHHIAFRFEPEKGNVLTVHTGRTSLLPDWYFRYHHHDPLHTLVDDWAVSAGFYGDFGEDGVGLLQSSIEQAMQAKTDGRNGSFTMDGIMSAYQGAWAIKYIGFDFIFGMGTGPYSSDLFFPRLLVKPEYAKDAVYNGEQHFPWIVGPFTFELITRDIPNTIFKSQAKAPRRAASARGKQDFKKITLPIGRSAARNGDAFPKVNKKINFVDTRQ